MARAHKITAAEASAARWKQHHEQPERWFWNRVDRAAGNEACWPWKGRTMKRRGGYGRLTFKGRMIGAHRMALTLAAGAPPSPEFEACHSCDNPICCNPNHLWWGTGADNAKDSSAKGRRSSRRKIDRAELARLRRSGWSYSRLAEHFNVNQASIGKALRARAQAPQSPPRADAVAGVKEGRG